MGMPGWAIPLGVALKAPDTIKDVFGLYTGIRDDNRKEADLAQAKSDLSQFAQDPNYMPDYSKYSDPKLAMQTGALLTGQRDMKNQRDAAPVSKMLSRFAAEGNDSDPNFTGAEWLKGMATTYPVDGKTMTPEEYDNAMSGAVAGGKKGAIPLSAFGANPVTAGLLQGAELAAQQKGTMARAFGAGRGASPMDLAAVAMDKDKAIGLKDTMQGLHDQAGTQMAQTKYADEQTALQNKADYEASLAGISGRHRDAQPIIDGQTPTGPNVYNGLDYSDASGKPTANRIRPLNEVNDLVMQAASAYKQDPKEALARFAKEYQDTYSDADGNMSSANWLGKEADRTKNQLYLSAANGDKKAQQALTQMQQDEIAQAAAKRQIIVNNPPPKTEGSGNHGRLVQAFDKETRDLVYVSQDDIKNYPARYAPAAAQMKANQQATLIEDIRGTINNSMASLDKLPAFTSSQQAQLAMVLKHRDPSSAVSTFIGSKVGQTLTPAQVDYVTDLAVLKENILAMRSLLGGGQGSQDQRAAIEATIPSAIHPDKAYAKVQLQKALRTLDRLNRGTANGSLRPETGADGATTGQVGKYSYTVK